MRSGLRFACPQVEGVFAKHVRGLADTMQRHIGSEIAGKAAVVVSVSEDLKDSVDAVALLRAGVGGQGGGARLDFAQAAAPYPRRRGPSRDPARAGEPAGRS